MDQSRTFQPKDDLVYRKVADESLLVPIREKLADMQRVFALNPVAALVWECLDGDTPVSRIVQNITEEFDVDSATAGNDVVAFIEDLIDQELVTEKGRGSGRRE